MTYIYYTQGYGSKEKNYSKRTSIYNYLQFTMIGYSFQLLLIAELKKKLLYMVDVNVGEE